MGVMHACNRGGSAWEGGSLGGLPKHKSRLQREQEAWKRHDKAAVAAAAAPARAPTTVPPVSFASQNKPHQPGMDLHTASAYACMCCLTCSPLAEQSSQCKVWIRHALAAAEVHEMPQGCYLMPVSYTRPLCQRQGRLAQGCSVNAHIMNSSWPCLKENHGGNCRQQLR